MSGRALLEVAELRVGFVTEGGLLQAVDRVGFELRAGEVLAIVGESGSGKSVAAQTLVGLTRAPGARIEGSVRLGGEELLDAGDEELRRVRGERIAMVFQDPMTSFNPVYRVGEQIVEAIRAHRPRTAKAAARERAEREKKKAEAKKPAEKKSICGFQASSRSNHAPATASRHVALSVWAGSGTGHMFGPSGVVPELG